MGSAFFFQRINDHIQYLHQLELSLKDEGDFQGVDHHDCRLGQWLYGRGRDEIAACGESTACLEMLLTPHQQFHEAAKRALQAHKDGRSNEQKSNVTEMFKLSNILISKMMELDRLSRH